MGQGDWKQRIHDDLRRRGWHLMSGLSPTLLDDVAESLGTVVAGLTRDNLLMPRHPHEARAGTFSAAVGLGAQPFHTDGAHWPTPPRYIILRHVAGETCTVTLIIDLASAHLSRLRNAMRASAWYVRSRRAFLASGSAQLRG